MAPAFVLLLAFLIGVVCGLRALTAPAVVACSARLGWINLSRTPLHFMGTSDSAVIFTVLAILELGADQLPSAPSRLKPPGLIARIALGALSGAALVVSGSRSIAVGAILGAAGGICGAFGGFEVRTRLVKSLKVPDFVIAILEDAVAIAGGFFLVSRF